MKNIKLLYGMIFFSLIPLHGADNSIASTIFVPISLVQPYCKKTWEQSYIHAIKKAAIPLTCYFCYSINKNSIWTDIKENPYSSAILIYATIYYCMDFALKSKENKIEEEIINLMQDLFCLLIISHSMYNKIINSPSSPQHKISTTTDVFMLSNLKSFLHKTYDTWSTMFSYYQKHHKNKDQFLYAYNLNQINTFDIAQACSHDPEMLTFVTQIYNKNNISYDCESIINFLENKLSLINHKLIPILPTQYQDDYKK
ncbi:MAG: hypothetical protein JO129_02565 [Candidatus Dependentiae bacterium]|nr:hypothetical protein [Candidatus Dependentiae bacterium]